MKILAIGDVVGVAAAEFLEANLWKIRSMLSADFVAANCENVCEIHGLSSEHAELLLRGGVDVITSGNHIWSRRDIYSVLDDNNHVLRPANYPSGNPGRGHTILDAQGYRILCINVQGTVFFEPLANPFLTVEKILRDEEGRYDFAVLDIHAEATSEKIAVSLYFDGRISAVWGTHTHVQTADEKILPLGTGYITDLGMTGPENGILGAEKDPVIAKFLTNMPQRFAVASGETVVCGALFDIDTSSGKVTSVKRLHIPEGEILKKSNA